MGGASDSPRQLRARRGLSGLVVLLDRLIDRFEQRPLFGWSVQGQHDRPVRTTAKKFFDLRRDAAGRYHDIKSAACKNRGELIEGLDRRGAMSLALEHRLDF